MEEKEKEGKEGRRKGKVRDMGTLENLVSAFIGESMARNRYTFYASIAKEAVSYTHLTLPTNREV